MVDNKRLNDLFTEPRELPSEIGNYEWKLIGGNGRFGSWTRKDGQERARALAVFQGKLYAAIGPVSADVWQFDGENWERIGGAGVRGSWDAFEDVPPAAVGYRPALRWVNVLVVDPTDKSLHAGVKSARGAQVWRFDGSSWELVGGGVGNGDWHADAYDHVYSLTWHQDQLYAGMQGFLSDSDAYDPEQGNAEIFRYDGNRWERIAGDGKNGSWDKRSCAMWVYQLLSFGDTLYAAIGRHGVGGKRWVGEVWRFSNERWERIGGEGERGSWNPSCTNLVTSLIAYQDKLIIGFNTPDVTLRQGAFGNVWTWDPRKESWHELCQTVDSDDENLVKSQTMLNTSLVYNGNLIMGGGAPHSLEKLGIWYPDIAANRWRCFARPGMRHFTSADDAALWNEGRYAYAMTQFEGDIFLGVKGYEGTAHVWRCYM